MLYFDYNPKESAHYGTIRQQIWALLHFPFHFASVLVLEGAKELLRWQNANDSVRVAFGIFDTLSKYC